MAAKKIAVTEQPVAKKIAVTEQSEEEPVKVVSPSDEQVIKEEAKQEPLTDIPEPSPREPEAAPRYESRSLDRLASGPRPLLHIDSHARGLVRRVKKHRLWVAVLLGVVLVLVVAGIYLLLKPTSSTNPLPKSVQQEVGFTLYYPRSSTGEYKYLDGSSSYAGGKLTYNLGSSGGPFIHVSEQALSVQPPDLHKLQNFSVFQAPAGEAAVGANGNVLNGVLIANKTLIILNGLGGVTMQDFIQTVNAMQP